MAKHSRVVSLLVALMWAPLAVLNSQQRPDPPWAQTALEAVEVPTPFVVRTAKGKVYSVENQPLAGAQFFVDRGHGAGISTSTGDDGSFEFKALKDPLGWLLHPILHRLAQEFTLKPGKYRFKVLKTGFCPAAGTVVISTEAPKASSIEVRLKSVRR